MILAGNDEKKAIAIFLQETGINKESREIQEEEIEYWRESQRAERNFFQMIEVDIDITVYGHYSKRFAQLEEVGAGGWTFTITGMKKFGIKNVYFQGEGEYPQKKILAKNEIHLFRLIE